MIDKLFWKTTSTSLTFLRLTSRNQVVPTDKSVDDSTLLTTLCYVVETNFVVSTTFALFNHTYATSKSFDIVHITLFQAQRDDKSRPPPLRGLLHSMFLVEPHRSWSLALRFVHALGWTDVAARPLPSPLEQLHNGFTTDGLPSRRPSIRTRWVDWENRAFDWRKVPN